MSCEHFRLRYALQIKEEAACVTCKECRQAA